MRFSVVIVLFITFTLASSSLAVVTAKSSAAFGSGSLNDVHLFHFDANVFRIRHVIPLNMSSGTELTVDVAVPGNDSFQKIWNVDSNPDPDLVFADSFGNERYRYLISTSQPNFINITITYDILVLFSHLVFRPDDVGTLNEIPPEIMQSYTKPDPYIESDYSEVVDNATSLVQGVANVYDRFLSLFNFVSNDTLFPYNISVSDIECDSSRHIRGALWCLRNHQGVCFDFACLLTALLRSIGIPARKSGGVALTSSPGFHAWTEVYLPRIGWVPCDPTWEVPNGNIHVKNPTYDGNTRWNYTLRKGRVYSFPYESKAIDDQVFVEILAKPRVYDTINVWDANHLNLTRKISFDEFDFDSYLIVSRDEGVDCSLSHTCLKISSSTEFFGISSVKYWSWFRHEPEEMEVTVYAPFNLIVNPAFRVLPSLSSVTFVNDFRTLYPFVVVQPVAWISFIIILIAVIAFQFRRKNRPRLH